MIDKKFRFWNIDGWAYITIGQIMDDVLSAVYSRACIDGKEFYEYTGLKDKNGKEIYEGDVLGNDRFTYKVVFENAGFYLYHLSNEYLGRWGLLSSLFETRMEEINQITQVIGNIHENPELLNQKA